LVGAGDAPIEIEIGPGRGGFVFERLAADPDVFMLGLEIRRKWATIVDNRVRERGLSSRARVLAEDARSAFPRFPDACARAVFVHFPDPWWKKRHAKRLVVTTELLPQLCRVLIPGGALFIQTDVAERAAEYAALVASEPRLVPQHPGFEAENPYQARSPREHRAIADGLPIYRLHYRLA
jgi:tRNA (guanine-N7-)-methyltransferase